MDFSLFLWLAGAFVLGGIFGGRIAWKRGLRDEGWLWWKAFSGKR